MGREMWATYSVNDHLRARAFIADVMLFDKLVIPVPPDEAGRAEWRERGWDPDRQAALIDLLGPIGRPIEWDASLRARWNDLHERQEAAAAVADEGAWAFQATRTVLTQGVPSHVTALEAVTAYPTIDALRDELGVRTHDGGWGVPAGALAIIGRAFLVPDDDARTDEELLRMAVELASDSTYVRKRASYYRWQREFLASPCIDADALRAAGDEMEDLLADLRRAATHERVKVGTQFAFVASTVAVGLAAGPLAPLALAGAFLSLGQFVADRWLSRKDAQTPSPMAAIYDAQKHFGWR